MCIICTFNGIAFFLMEYCRVIIINFIENHFCTIIHFLGTYGSFQHTHKENVRKNSFYHDKHIKMNKCCPDNDKSTGLYEKNILLWQMRASYLIITTLSPCIHLIYNKNIPYLYHYLFILLYFLIHGSCL